MRLTPTEVCGTVVQTSQFCGTVLPSHPRFLFFMPNDENETESTRISDEEFEQLSLKAIDVAMYLAIRNQLEQCILHSAVCYVREVFICARVHPNWQVVSLEEWRESLCEFAASALFVADKYHCDDWHAAHWYADSIRTDMNTILQREIEVLKCIQWKSNYTTAWEYLFNQWCSTHGVHHMVGGDACTAYRVFRLQPRARDPIVVDRACKLCTAMLLCAVNYHPRYLARFCILASCDDGENIESSLDPKTCNNVVPHDILRTLRIAAVDSIRKGYEYNGAVTAIGSAWPSVTSFMLQDSHAFSSALKRCRQ